MPSPDSLLRSSDNHPSCLSNLDIQLLSQNYFLIIVSNLIVSAINSLNDIVKLLNYQKCSLDDAADDAALFPVTQQKHIHTTQTKILILNLTNQTQIQ